MTSSDADEGTTFRTSHGARLLAVRPTLSEFILEDAPGRAGHLSQGHRPDPDPGRHLPRRPGTRGRGRVRGSDHGPAAGRGPEGSVLGYELREDFAARAQANVASFLGAERSPYRVEIATSTRGSTRPGWTGWCSTCPSRGTWSSTPRRPCTRAGSSCAYLPTIGQVARCGRSWTAPPSGWPRRWRCCSARGTSRASRCAPTTGWWPTPASSPPPGCSPPNPRTDLDMNMLDVIILATLGHGRATAGTASASWPVSSRGPAWPWALWWPTASFPTWSGWFSSSDPEIRLLAAVAFLVGAAMIGQGLGLAVGSLLPLPCPSEPGCGRGTAWRAWAWAGWECWPRCGFSPPALAAVPGWTAQETRGSAVVGAIADRSPPTRRKPCRPCAGSWPTAVSRRSSTSCGPRPTRDPHPSRVCPPRFTSGWCAPP